MKNRNFEKIKLIKKILRNLILAAKKILRKKNEK